MTIQISIDIVNEVESRINERLKNQNYTTGMIRSISSSVFRTIEDKSIDHVLGLCEELLEKRKSALGVVAYDWAFRMKKQYTKETFYIFEKWLKKYVKGWGDCDDFCTHAFGELLFQYSDLVDKTLIWTEHPDFAVRRAAAVVLIYPIKKGKLRDRYPFVIADKLMNDEHYLVLKGYGWMLKVLSIVEPEGVCDYLIKNKEQMPRISFRYALEKLDKAKKAILMGDKIQ